MCMNLTSWAKQRPFLTTSLGLSCLLLISSLTASGDGLGGVMKLINIFLVFPLVAGWYIFIGFLADWRYRTSKDLVWQGMVLFLYVLALVIPLRHLVYFGLLWNIILTLLTPITWMYDSFRPTCGYWIHTQWPVVFGNSLFYGDAVRYCEEIFRTIGYVAFVIEPDKFIIAAEGDLTKAHIEIPKSESTKITVGEAGKVRSKYAVEYLKKMTNGGKLADEVVISIGSNYPLRLDYKAVDKVMLSFILAPRVDND